MERRISALYQRDLTAYHRVLVGPVRAGRFAIRDKYACATGGYGPNRRNRYSRPAGADLRLKLHNDRLMRATGKQRLAQHANRNRPAAIYYRLRSFKEMFPEHRCKAQDSGGRSPCLSEDHAHHNALVPISSMIAPAITQRRAASIRSSTNSAGSAKRAANS